LVYWGEEGRTAARFQQAVLTILPTFSANFWRGLDFFEKLGGPGAVATEISRWGQCAFLKGRLSFSSICS